MPSQPKGRRLRPAALAVFLLLAAALPAGGGAWAAARVALVVGNSAYQSVPKLANPWNDARDVAAALTRLGFEVDLRRDLDRKGLWSAVRQLAQRAKGAEAALLFYAGHGVHKDREAYLIPVDAALEDEHDLAADAARLRELMAPLRAQGRTTLVFLDACRDDPFAAGDAGGDATRGLVPGTGPGVGEVSAPGGTLIAYATGEGYTAADGSTRNSPFTAALLEHIETPGLELRSMLVKVRERLDTTGGRQVSETSDSLVGEFYFKPAPRPEVAAVAPPAAAAAAPPPPAPGSLAERADFVLWKAIEGSEDPRLFELFLKQHPDSPIAPAARTRLASLGQPKTAPAPTRPPQVAARERPPAAPAPPPPPAPPRNDGPGAAGPQVAALPTAPAAATEERNLPPRPPADAVARVVRSGVNLRRGRGGQAPKLGLLPAGTAVMAAATAKGGWVEVWTEDGRHGFVADGFLADPGATAAEPAAAPQAAPRAKAAKAVAKAPPARAAGEVFRDCLDCPELVAVRPGEVEVGSPEDEPGRDDDEGPRRLVRIGKPLAIGRFEVTFAEWDACVGDGGCGGHRPDDEGWGRGRRPVVNVSFDDARAYLDWLGRRTGKRYRLLGEAEWEYVARAGDARGASPWGEEDSRACRSANLHDETSWRENGFAWPAARCSDGHARTAEPAASRANRFGVADMLGNVAEWAADCWSPDLADLPAGGAPLEAGGDCARRPVRGGHWHAQLDDVRYAARAPARSDTRTRTDGFRVARDLDEGLREVGPGGATLAAGAGSE